MNSRPITVLVISIAASLAATLELRAAQRILPASGPLVRSGITTIATGNTLSVITGQVMDAARVPLPFARVRLLNLDSGAFISQTSTDHIGGFSFVLVSRGNYVAELVDRAGVVLAVGDPLTVEAGQTVGTIIVLPSRAPSFAGLFGNSAAAIVSAAAGAGITAVSAGQPLSPER